MAFKRGPRNNGKHEESELLSEFGQAMIYHAGETMLIKLGLLEVFKMIKRVDGLKKNEVFKKGKRTSKKDTHLIKKLMLYKKRVATNSAF